MHQEDDQDVRTTRHTKSFWQVEDVQQQEKPLPPRVETNAPVR